MKISKIGNKVTVNGNTEDIDKLYIEVKKKDARTVDISLRKDADGEVFGGVVYGGVVGMGASTKVLQQLKKDTGLSDIRQV